jgi:hypothetical protein
LSFANCALLPFATSVLTLQKTLPIFIVNENGFSPIATQKTRTDPFHTQKTRTDHLSRGVASP